MKKEKTTMIKEDELKQIYGGCIEEPSLKTGPFMKYMNFYLAVVYLFLMIYFRLFTDVDSVYYVSFIMPSAISVIFYKENMRTILFILIALLLYFAFIWIDFSFSNILYSIVGFFIAVVNIFILRKVKVNK